MAFIANLYETDTAADEEFVMAPKCAVKSLKRLYPSFPRTLAAP